MQPKKGRKKNYITTSKYNFVFAFFSCFVYWASFLNNVFTPQFTLFHHSIVYSNTPFPTENKKIHIKNETEEFPNHLLLYNITYVEHNNINLKYSHDDAYSLNVPFQKINDPALINIKQTISVFFNCYISSRCGVSDGEYLYMLSGKSPFTYIFQYNNDDLLTDFEEEVIAFGSKYCNVFGHWFIDTLLPLMLLPEDVIRRAKIIVQSTLPFQIDTLTAFGISKEQIISQESPHWVYARIAYVLVPFPFLNFVGESAYLLSDKLKKFYQVQEDEKADICYAMNRPIAKTRHIPDDIFQQIVSYFKTEYKNYKWEIFMNNAITMNRIVKIYSKAFFIFTPTGSGLIGIMFMKKHSAILCAEGDYLDCLFRGLASTFEVFYLVYRVPKGKHFETDPFNVNISDVKRLAKVAMFAAENGKWPAHNKDYLY